MHAYTSEQGDLTVLRLPPGSDLVDGITEAASALGIEAAWVSAIGALRRMTYGFYDQDAREYRTLHHEGEVELLNATGNVSLRDGEPFTHLHVTAATTDGAAFGGHAFQGCEVFVAEVCLRPLRGVTLARELDDATGLAMWPVE